MNSLNQLFSDMSARFSGLDKRVNNLETYESKGNVRAGAHAYKTVSQTGILGGWVAVVFEAELWDTDSFFTLGTNYFTVPYNGRYLVHSHFIQSWAVAPSQVDYRLLINNTYWHVKTTQPTNAAPDVSDRWLDLQTIVNLQAGQQVQVDVNITGVNALDIIQAGDPYDSYFQIELLAAT